MNKITIITLLLSMSIFGGCAVDPAADCHAQCEAAIACHDDSVISCDTACEQAVEFHQTYVEMSEDYGCESEYQTYYACRGSVGLEGEIMDQNTESVPLCIEFPECTDESYAYIQCVANADDPERHRSHGGYSGGGGGGSSGDDIIGGIMGLLILGSFLGF